MRNRSKKGACSEKMSGTLFVYYEYGSYLILMETLFDSTVFSAPVMTQR